MFPFHREGNKQPEVPTVSEQCCSDSAVPALRRFKMYLNCASELS